MKVLMFGWEFPPLSAGGLGTACYGLTKGLSINGIEITFVLPKLMAGINGKYVKLRSAASKKVKMIGINSPLQQYMTSESYRKLVQGKESFISQASTSMYGGNLLEEVHRYAAQAALVALEEDFDIIHCHDWLTFLAGIEAKKATGKRLIVQVHATEFDRGGGNGVNQQVYDIERAGMHFADRIVAVSQFTKDTIVRHYGIPADKVSVVYNAVEKSECTDQFKIGGNEKIVLFLGRITLQKGPEYFLYAAKKLLDFRKDVKFIMAGTGDMLPRMIELSADLGIADKVMFTGIVRGKEVDRLYRMADLYVMPSVSEPFGITPLESIINGTPVIISNQSGVSEILKNALKVDFWDVNDITNKMLAVLNYSALSKTLKEHGSVEIEKFTWERSAREMIRVYKRVLGW